MNGDREMKNCTQILLIVVLIGLATILTTSNVFAWSQCLWVRISNSHHAGADWCPNGWVITALDLDGCGYGDMHAMGDCPIIAQAKCCQPTTPIAAITDHDKNQQTLSADTVQGKVIVTGDILFQKNQVKLWRMFEDENGLYVQNMRTNKKYKLTLQEIGDE
jgi:hypothetical protein